MQILCESNHNIVLVIEDDEEDNKEDNKELFPKNPYQFVGLALHSIQQNQAEELLINGYKVEAILMDQTCGIVDPDDIFKTNFEQPYQRLKNIINNTLQIV